MGLYGVSSDKVELRIMETFTTLKLTEYLDPLKFYTSIIGSSRKFEACDKSGGVHRKIFKGMGDTWEIFAPTMEQK